MARRVYLVEEVIPIIFENDSSDSNGEDSIDLDPADSGSEDELVNNLVEEIH